MAYTVEDILIEVGRQIHDPGFVTFTRTEVLYSAINSGLLNIVLARPDATAETYDFTLAQTCKQDIPADGYKFLRLTRNLGVGGSVPGKAIRKKKRELIDEVVPDWTTEETSTAIAHYVFEEENPRTFHIYPTPDVATLHVELVYSKIPTKIDSDEDVLGISDVFVAALTEWVLWRCLAMEQDGSSMGLAQSHLQTFYTILGLKQQADQVLASMMQSNQPQTRSNQ